MRIESGPSRRNVVRPYLKEKRGETTVCRTKWFSASCDGEKRDILWLVHQIPMLSRLRASNTVVRTQDLYVIFKFSYEIIFLK